MVIPLPHSVNVLLSLHFHLQFLWQNDRTHFRMLHEKIWRLLLSVCDITVDEFKSSVLVKFSMIKSIIKLTLSGNYNEEIVNFILTLKGKKSVLKNKKVFPWQNKLFLQAANFFFHEICPKNHRKQKVFSHKRFYSRSICESINFYKHTSL